VVGPLGIQQYGALGGHLYSLFISLPSPQFSGSITQLPPSFSQSSVVGGVVVSGGVVVGCSVVGGVVVGDLQVSQH